MNRSDNTYSKNIIYKSFLPQEILNNSIDFDYNKKLHLEKTSRDNFKLFKKHSKNYYVNAVEYLSNAINTLD